MIIPLSNKVLKLEQEKVLEEYLIKQLPPLWDADEEPN
jgi:hypothetical protein